MVHILTMGYRLMEKPPTVAFPAQPVTSREAGQGCLPGLVPGRRAYGPASFIRQLTRKRPE